MQRNKLKTYAVKTPPRPRNFAKKTSGLKKINEMDCAKYNAVYQSATAKYIQFSIRTIRKYSRKQTLLGDRELLLKRLKNLKDSISNEGEVKQNIDYKSSRILDKKRSKKSKAIIKIPQFKFNHTPRKLICKRQKHSSNNKALI